jgi:hypothetical protein
MNQESPKYWTDFSAQEREYFMRTGKQTDAMLTKRPFLPLECFCSHETKCFFCVYMRDKSMWCFTVGIRP